MTCPSEPIPAGWQVWSGPVPAPLVQFAMRIRDNVRRYKRGTIAETVEYNGQTVAAWVSSHTWTFRKNPDGTMTLATGLCLSGVSLLTPTTSGSGAAGATPAPGPDAALAVYSADEPGTNWGLVAAGAIASAAVIGGFWWVLHRTRTD